MNLPKWLAHEIDELGRAVKSGEVDREEAIDTLTDHAFDKDEDWVREVIIAHLSGKLDSAIKKIKDTQTKRAERELDRLIVGEATFDDICSDYWPRDTFGPRTPLEELGHHDEEMLGLADRHMTRANERHARYIELVKAAQGNLQMSWEDAERRRLGIETGSG